MKNKPTKISTTTRHVHILKYTPSKKQMADYKQHIRDINITNKACLLFFVTKRNKLNTERGKEFSDSLSNTMIAQKACFLHYFRVASVFKGWFYSSNTDSTIQCLGLSFSGQVAVSHTAQTFTDVLHSPTNWNLCRLDRIKNTLKSDNSSWRKNGRYKQDFFCKLISPVGP